MKERLPRARRDVDPVLFNRAAWNRLVRVGNEWTRAVDPEVVRAAGAGNWNVVVTPTRSVPRCWFGGIRGKRILALASGGGQQAPILAAAGARVTSYDNSSAQLQQDRWVADRDGLDLRCIQGCMMDLGGLFDERFDIVFNLCSVCFVPDVRVVWRECHRVLKPGGRLVTGFSNPVRYLFDQKRAEHDELVVANQIPYCDLEDMNEAELVDYQSHCEPMEYSHTLEDLLGGQTDAGFHIQGMFEDDWPVAHDPVSAFINGVIATIAIKS